MAVCRAQYCSPEKMEKVFLENRGAVWLDLRGTPDGAGRNANLGNLAPSVRKVQSRRSSSRGDYAKLGTSKVVAESWFSFSILVPFCSFTERSQKGAPLVTLVDLDQIRIS